MKRICLFLGLLAIESTPTSLFGVIKLARVQAHAPELLAQRHAQVVSPAPAALPVPVPAPAPVVAPAPAAPAAPAPNPWEGLQEFITPELLGTLAWDLLKLSSCPTPAEASGYLLGSLLRRVASTSPLTSSIPAVLRPFLGILLPF